MEYTWQNIEPKYFNNSISKNKIIEIIDSITSKYTIHFYKYEDIIHEIPINNNNTTFILQNYLFYKVYTKYVIQYEKLNNINFTFIIKTRPDIY